MNRLMRSHGFRTGAVLLAALGALVLAGCPPENAFVIGDGTSTNWAAWIDYHGDVQTKGPISTEVDPESGDLDAHPGIPEFLVKNGQGQIVARVDGQSGSLYLLGQLYHVPNLETSAAARNVRQRLSPQNVNVLRGKKKRKGPTCSSFNGYTQLVQHGFNCPIRSFRLNPCVQGFPPIVAP